MEDATIPPSGTLQLRGGVVAAKGEILATTKKDALTHGYKKHVIFDERFMVNIPSTFPKTVKFEVVSWLEKKKMVKLFVSFQNSISLFE